MNSQKEAKRGSRKESWWIGHWRTLRWVASYN